LPNPFVLTGVSSSVSLILIFSLITVLPSRFWGG